MGRRDGLYKKPARPFSDTRSPDYVEHSVPGKPRQRVLDLALGYE